MMRFGYSHRRVAGAALFALLTLPGAVLAQRARGDELRPTLARDRLGGWVLDLPPAAEDALDRFDRDFEPWQLADYARSATAALDGYVPSPRQVPWAVIGDFNGDGRLDVAVAGRDDRDALVVLVLSTGRSRYRAVEADREPFDPDAPETVERPVLRYMYPGRYVIADPRLVYPREVVVEQPAVELTGGRRPGPTLLTVERDRVARYYLTTRPAAVRRSAATRGDLGTRSR